MKLLTSEGAAKYCTSVCFRAIFYRKVIRDPKPTVRMFPRTLSRMAGLKSYNNVRKYFHPNNKSESKPHSAFLGRSVCYYKK